MRGEIRRICKTAGFTTIYVTHDQREALSVADRIAVLKDGKLIQVGTPAELYHKPRTSFVAEFIGQTNLLPGIASGDRTVDTAAGRVIVEQPAPAGAHVILSIRPEQIRVAGSQITAPSNRFVGKVLETTFLGEASEHVLLVNGQRLRVIST